MFPKLVVYCLDMGINVSQAGSLLSKFMSIDKGINASQAGSLLSTFMGIHNLRVCIALEVLNEKSWTGPLLFSMYCSTL